MQITVVSFDQKKSKLKVSLSGLKDKAEYTYNIDTDKVDFEEIEAFIEADLKTKNKITSNLQELNESKVKHYDPVIKEYK